LYKSKIQNYRRGQVIKNLQTALEFQRIFNTVSLSSAWCNDTTRKIQYKIVRTGRRR